MYSVHPLHSLAFVVDGEKEHYWPICLVGLLVTILGTPSPPLIEIEKFMNPLRKVRGVSQFSALLLVSLYSYRMRELLVCWLFFSALFAALAFLVLIGALACYAGKYAIHWVNATAPVAPVVGLGPDEPYLKTDPDSITLK